MSKNFKVTSREDGKEYWVSRHMAVVACIVAVDKDYNFKFLVTQRGKGAADNIGQWAFPCGYLDRDETLIEALHREVYEETGLVLKDLPTAPKIEQFGINDVPELDALQNVSVRYTIFVKMEEIKSALSSGVINIHTDLRGGEENEVSAIKLIKPSRIIEFSWAFNHDNLMTDICKSIFKGL